MTDHEELEEMKIPEEEDEEEDDEMSILDKIINVFLDPAALFKRLAEKPEWIMPLVLIILVNAGLFLAMRGPTADYTLEMKRVGWQQVAEARFDSDKEKADFITESERDYVEGGANTELIITLAFLPIGVAIALFIAGGVLYLISLIQGLETKYFRLLSVVTFYSLIALLGNVLDKILKVSNIVKPDGLIGWQLPVTSLAYYLPEKTHAVYKTVSALADPFAIWGFIVLTIGLIHVNRSSKKQAIVTLIIFLVLTVLFLVGAGFVQHWQMSLVGGDGGGGRIVVE